MYTLNLKGRLQTLHNPMIMGIINCTPDSFYARSRHAIPMDALSLAGHMIRDGADILDIGGQSTRPGSVRISAEAEMARVLPVIRALREAYPELILSIDTYHASVAESAVNAGADMVNDISGGWMDPEMLKTVGRLSVPFVCMHLKGSPGDTQDSAVYADILQEVTSYFIERIEACRKAGIHDIILDPGFGFGKTREHSLHLFQQMESLALLQLPLLVGVSRKSMIFKTLGIGADQALNATTVMHTLAVQKGAAILRVHDVREAREVLLMMAAVREAGRDK